MGSNADAERFGVQRGWKLGRFFSWRALAGVKTRTEDYVPRTELPPFCDHDWFYRVGRKPAAIVTFPYDFDEEEHVEAVAFAEKHGLICEVCIDFPNWYGHNTTMVVWTRAH